MRPHRKLLRIAAVLILSVCTACTATSPAAPPPVTPSPTPTIGSPAPTTSATRRRTAPDQGRSPTPAVTRSPVEGTGPDDPRWRFFVPDRSRHRSPWFDGAQRVMIGYGCTPAPYYSPDPRCRGDGFHHGIDVALPCRTTIRAGVRGLVVDPDAAGRPGPAYGSTAFRLRVQFRGRSYDVLIGHSTRVLVRPGHRVRAGERIAIAGARGSPDGCHLHFEQRAVGGGVRKAVDPTVLLGLRPD